MQKFIMLVGLPGSGKSTYAKELLSNDPSYSYFSSDSIRKERYGDENIQGDASQIFSIMQNRTLDALKKGWSVIYDATGIKRKDRLGILNRVKSLKMDIQCECHIVWARFETCIERNNNRERVVPEEVIWRMAKQFQTPWYDEGWDEIKVIVKDDRYNLSDINNKLSEMNHDNSHHINDSILNHIDRVGKELNKVIYSKDFYEGYDRNVRCGNMDKLLHLATIHDIGKIYTKDFHNSKGEITEDAHYYQHQNVGAYMVLGLFHGYQIICNKDNPMTSIEASYLTLLHMEPFFDKQPSNYWKKEVDPEIKKLIYLFNECDRKGA